MSAGVLQAEAVLLAEFTPQPLIATREELAHGALTQFRALVRVRQHVAAALLLVESVPIGAAAAKQARGCGGFDQATAGHAAKP